MTSSVRSPLNFKSCGGVPSDAWPAKWFRSPMVVGPSMRMNGPMTLPEPIETPASITAYAPTSTSCARSASVLTIAVGWICAIRYSGRSVMTLSISASATI